MYTYSLSCKLMPRHIIWQWSETRQLCSVAGLLRCGIWQLKSFFFFFFFFNKICVEWNYWMMHCEVMEQVLLLTEAGHRCAIPCGQSRGKGQEAVRSHHLQDPLGWLRPKAQLQQLLHHSGKRCEWIFFCHCFFTSVKARVMERHGC